MQMNLTKLASALLLGSSLVGCAAVVKTPYEQPAINMPGSFQNNKVLSQQIHADILADQWWTLFKDPQLNNLVNKVLAQNTDLAVAGISLQQARIQARQAQSQQGVRIGDAGLTTRRSFDLEDGDSSSGFGVNYPGLSYELDLFGKLANQTEAARWEALASEEDLQATAQSLIGTTAQLYWQLAYLNERYSVVQQNLATAQKTYDLVRVQYRAGAVSGLDLTQAEQAIQSQQATLSQIAQQRVETRTGLAVLLHMPVQQLAIQEPSRLPNIQLPSIQADLPASLLSRRPDLRATELRLRKALANKDANKASYYPSISLTGALSTGVGVGANTSLTDALKNPVATLGAGLTLPFLQWNDMKRDLQVNELEYEKAIIQYRQTIYEAFADVENALSNRTELTKQVALQQRNVELTERTERLTEVRYRNGAVALKNLLDAQETTRNARLSLVQTRQNQYNAYVTLMQALGGSPIKQLP
ncbi:efflux transporter outer membrane subunit [Acinetobacter lwoffii]|uniref:efflux transporter outer membrane subunit n=1 Tax=Acinetobacter lwoffii TaxID=28090 RepID=UPI0012DE4C9B|nr:efflux transporter outer membrane subunit [Acinetobacter lwoffii]MCU4421418.1 efflux transporter outer membrane subunit [Acinetobacter lwoffii]MCU4450300.1 efflux transporter outer membrane subunit [Acinetobacter lwoffii]NGP40927.1 efflux transporter outer membrane subunit [Acinetobacter lwoffii]QGR75344.1 efflux transporter outer membrane subunit [Acinetobacter lwoffii]QKT98408.1 efflux transporter outer membrane subunit [Acinetobacter lwoffii]